MPTLIDVTPAGGGEYDERAVLESTFESDRLYVADHGYAKFALFNNIGTAGSSDVGRLRDNSAKDPVNENDHNDDAAVDEIISGELVRQRKVAPLGRTPCT